MKLELGVVKNVIYLGSEVTSVLPELVYGEECWNLTSEVEIEEKCTSKDLWCLRREWRIR